MEGAIFEIVNAHLDMGADDAGPFVRALVAAVKASMVKAAPAPAPVRVAVKTASPKRTANAYSLTMRVIAIAGSSDSEDSHVQFREYLGNRTVVPGNHYKDQASPSAKKYLAKYTDLAGSEITLLSLIQRIKTDENGAAAAGLLWGMLDATVRNEAAEMVRPICK